MDEGKRPEGLRERKKRQTRQYLSDVATGLFLERGFDAVTVAEIAEACEVSVNTVYNYFPAKEDLFFDRSKGVVDRMSRWVRGRRAGESAAAAVLRELREEVEAVSPRVGLFEGYERFMKVIHGSAALKARLWYFQQETADHLERTLCEEAGAEEGDLLPVLVAGQLNWVHATVMAHIGRAMTAGGTPSQVSRDALALLDEVEGLLGERVLNYGTRERE